MLKISRPFFAPLFVLAASCGGGNSVPAVPQTATAGAQRHTAGRMFVALPLPANFVPSAIMRDGQVPGAFGTHAAIYDKGRIRDLGTLPGANSSVALSSNARGDAVGYTVFSFPAHPRPLVATLYSAGSAHDLNPQAPTDQAESADVISDRGDIYGTSDNELFLDTLDLVKFLPAGGLEHLNPVNGQRAAGFIADINSSSRFTGFELPFFQGFDNLGSQASVGSGLTFTPLNLNVFTSTATAINDAGNVAGYVDLSNNQVETSGTWTAFVSAQNRTTYLPFLPGSTQMQPTGINNRGDVVGTSDVFGPDFTVFVYSRGTLVDAAKLVTPAVSITQLFHGLSNQGAFVVGTTSGYYLIEPAAGR